MQPLIRPPPGTTALQNLAISGLQAPIAARAACDCAIADEVSSESTTPRPKAILNIDKLPMLLFASCRKIFGLTLRSRNGAIVKAVRAISRHQPKPVVGTVVEGGVAARSEVASVGQGRECHTGWRRGPRTGGNSG